MLHEHNMETITFIPATLIGNRYYVNCKNQAMGWGKMHRGRSVEKCKNGCSHYRGYKDKTLWCAWDKANKQVRT